MTEPNLKLPFNEKTLHAKSIKPIKGYDGYYIDNVGNVYSRWINKAKHGVVLGNQLKKLKPRVNKSGHHHIALGRAYQRLIHRLVYETFIGDIPPGFVVRHLNDIPSDNRTENLAIGTQKDNMRDCMRNGHHKANAKIDIADYEEIAKLKSKLTWKQLAELYSVNEKTVRNHMQIYKQKQEGIS